MITWSKVAALDPALASVPAATQAVIIEFVYLQLSPVRWGAKLDMAATFLCAHVAQLSARSGAGTGPVTREKLADAEVDYAAPFIVDTVTNYDATAWGKAFRTLQRQLGVLGFVTRG